jgi:murein DD-endopeptidase MepM/ murein hydrolase activator NlpD
MKKPLIILGTLSLLYLMTTSKALAKVTKTNKIRGCDPKGCGYFGASRGDRDHAGIDIITFTGESIFSPITGKVTRHPIPYANDNRYNGIEIVNSQYKIKMFYLKPIAQIGNQVIAGQAIGTAQNLALKFGTSMTNHVHVEMYDSKNNLIDPTPFFN